MFSPTKRLHSWWVNSNLVVCLDRAREPIQGLLFPKILFFLLLDILFTERFLIPFFLPFLFQLWLVLFDVFVSPDSPYLFWIPASLFLLFLSKVTMLFYQFCCFFIDKQAYAHLFTVTARRFSRAVVTIPSTTTFSTFSTTTEPQSFIQTFTNKVSGWFKSSSTAPALLYRPVSYRLGSGCRCILLGSFFFAPIITFDFRWDHQNEQSWPVLGSFT